NTTPNAYLPSTFSAMPFLNGNSLHYSCLENPMDRGAWPATAGSLPPSHQESPQTFSIKDQMQEYWSGLPFPPPRDLGNCLLEPRTRNEENKWKEKCFLSLYRRLSTIMFNSLPPHGLYSLPGSSVHGILRARILVDSVVEILFEQDNEEKSVATLILDSLIQCPIDTRKQLAENLVIIGGTSMLPGFLHRLLAEIRYLVEKPKYKKTLATKTFRIHTPPAKANCVAWLGGAIFGALQDILGSRSVSKDYYNQTGRIPDWCSLNNPPLEMMFDVGKSQPPLMKRAFSTEK
ncbi:hypothetical protein FD755_013053, partial [Muntiacus reevesi]